MAEDNNQKSIREANQEAKRKLKEGPIEVEKQIETETKDEKGNILGVYNKNGDITKYKYDAGGNVISSSKNGESIYERTHYTPPEAAAAMPDKNAKYSIKIDF